MAVLVLSDEDWSYLERQARRRRVARSLSDRCRSPLHGLEVQILSRRPRRHSLHPLLKSQLFRAKLNYAYARSPATGLPTTP